MKIIAGLGNPGRKYEHTRHNMGFDAIDILSDRYRIPVQDVKFHGLVGSGYIEGQKVVLVKPQTFMNLSGQCLREVCAFYKIDPEEDLLVICDDISLDPGKIRLRAKGSAGGHNGLKDIIASLGTQVFARVKVGVGAKPEGWDLADYVLGRPMPSESADLIDACDRAARAAADWTMQSMQDVMNRYN